MRQALEQTPPTSLDKEAEESPLPFLSVGPLLQMPAQYTTATVPARLQRCEGIVNMARASSPPPPPRRSTGLSRYHLATESPESTLRRCGALIDIAALDTPERRRRTTPMVLQEAKEEALCRRWQGPLCVEEASSCMHCTALLTPRRELPARLRREGHVKEGPSVPQPKPCRHQGPFLEVPAAPEVPVVRRSGPLATAVSTILPAEAALMEEVSRLASPCLTLAETAYGNQPSILYR